MKVLGITARDLRSKGRGGRACPPDSDHSTPSLWRATLQGGRLASASTQSHRSESERKRRRSGLTLIELIVAFTILLILSTMALPLAHVKVQREKERRLRDALTEMRKAIDRYKDAADAGKLDPGDPDTHGYPPTLEMLVEGVPMQGGGGLPGSQLTPSAGQGFGQPGGAFGNQSRSGFGGQSRGGFGGQPGSGPGSQGGFGSQSRSGFGSQSRGGFGGSTREGSGSSSSDGEEQKIRFLRRIPVDPITNSADWGLRSVQDDPDSMSWGGQNVFDVHSKSMDTALDGTRYQEW